MNRNAVLVTGAAGYIGSALTQLLISQDRPVIGVDSTAAPSWTDPPSTLLEWHSIDLQRRVPLSWLERTSVVIHLAGVSDGVAGRRDPNRTHVINVGILEQLLSACKRGEVPRFVYASTFGVYGTSYDVPLHEGLEPLPCEPYSASKLAGEHLIRAAFAPMETISLRLAMACGPSPATRFDLLLNALIRAAVNNKRLVIQGGDQRRPLIHVQDASQLLLHLADGPSQLCDGRALNSFAESPSVAELARCVVASAPGPVSLDVVPARPKETSFVLDDSLVRRLYGQTPRRSYKQAIDDLFQTGTEN